MAILTSFIYRINNVKSTPPYFFTFFKRPAGSRRYAPT